MGYDRLYNSINNLQQAHPLKQGLFFDFSDHWVYAA